MAVETFSQDVIPGRLPSTPLSCGFTLGFIRSPKKKLQDFSAADAKTLQSLFSKIKSIHYQLFTGYIF